MMVAETLASAIVDHPKANNRQTKNEASQPIFLGKLDETHDEESSNWPLGNTNFKRFRESRRTIKPGNDARASGFYLLAHKAREIYVKVRQ
tara:strand:- start:12 stop:284 length:273 start_codon:yes stop_codon:yes gene_type:complete